MSRTPFAINSTTNSREVSWAKPVSQVHGDSCTPHLQGHIPSAVRLGIVARGEKGRVRRTMPINDSKMPRPWRRNHETRQTQLRPHYSTHLARPKAALHGSGEHAERYFVHETEHRSSESTNTVQGCHTSPPPGSWGGGAMDAHRKGPTVRTPNTTHVMLNMIATAFPSTRAIYRSMQEHRGEWT